MRRTIWALALLSSLLLAARVQATVSYSYITDFPSGTPVSSGTKTVNIYLQETVNGGSTSLIASAAEKGLGGAAFRVDRISGPATLGTVTPQTGSGQNFSPNGSFNSNPANTSTSVNLIEGFTTAPTSGPTGTTPTTGVRLVLLAQVDITAAPNTTSTFTIAARGAPKGTVTLGSGFDLDITNNGTTSGPPAYIGAANNPTNFTIATVPEPVSGSILSAGVILLLCRRHRK